MDEAMLALFDIFDGCQVSLLRYLEAIAKNTREQLMNFRTDKLIRYPSYLVYLCWKY